MAYMQVQHTDIKTGRVQIGRGLRYKRPKIKVLKKCKTVDTKILIQK